MADNEHTSDAVVDELDAILEEIGLGLNRLDELLGFEDEDEAAKLRFAETRFKRAQAALEKLIARVAKTTPEQRAAALGERLAELARSKTAFEHEEGGDLCATLDDDPLPVRTREFRNWLRNAARRAGMTAPDAAVEAAIDLLDPRAAD